MGGSGGAGTDVNRWIVALTVMFSSLMVFLDTAVVNVSLPYIAGSLSSTVDEATWALTSYLASTAVVLPMSGWLAIYFGRRRLMILSVAGFTVASFLCGIAPNLPLLVVFRIAQGLTGGVMGPLSQSILLETFPPHERGKAMGFWSSGVIAAPILGPMLGGYLTVEANWRWVFYVNIPVGIVALVMTELFIFDPPYLRRETRRIDYGGMVLLVLGIGALQLALDKGQQEDWFSSGLISFSVAVAVASLVAFVVHELTIDEPVVDLRVFRDLSFTAGTLVSSLLFFILFGSMVLLPIFLQTLLDYSPFEAGLAMAPRGLGSLLATPFIGLLVSRVDTRKLLLLGLLIGGGTTVWLSRLSLDAGYWDIFWPQLLQGVALGLLFVPLTVASVATISKEQMGNATSVYNLMRNVGSSTGIAVVATILARRSILHEAVLRERFDGFGQGSVELIERIRAVFRARGLSEMQAADEAIFTVMGTIHEQARMLAFLDVFALLALIFAAMVPVVWLLRRPAT